MNKYTKAYNVILDNMDLFEYRLRPISAIMYIQDAFARMCATKKLTAYDLFATNQYWVVAGFNIDFTGKSPFWSEEVSVNIWVSEITNLKIYTDYEITSNGKTFAKGNALWFIIDRESKRPCKTDVAAERFEICDELTLGEHKKFTLPEKTDKVNENKHTNNLSDLDFNNHVNNKSYINLAEMTANDEFRSKYSLKKLSIKFNKETFLGDTLTCATYKTNEENCYVHTIEKDGTSICDISTSWEETTPTESIVEYNLAVKSEYY